MTTSFLVSKATRVSFQLYRTTNIFLPNLTKNADPSGDSYCRASTKSGDLAVSATVLDRHDLESEPQMLVNIGFRRTGNPEEKVN